MFVINWIWNLVWFHNGEGSACLGGSISKVKTVYTLYYDAYHNTNYQVPIKWALSGVSSRILYLTLFFFFLSTSPTDWKIFICKIVSQWENAPREILSIFTLTHVILFKINAFNLEIHERYLAIEKTEKLLSSPRKKRLYRKLYSRLSGKLRITSAL